MDILAYVIETLGLENVDTWKHGEDWLAKEQFQAPCSRLIHRGSRSPWFTLSMESSIQTAINIMAEHNLHRVALFDTSGQLASVLTQSALVRWLAARATPTRMGELTKHTVGDWGLGVRKVITVPNTEQAMSALVAMYHNAVTAVGIVNTDGHLVGNISVTDLKDMETGANLRKMFIPIETFLRNKVEGQGVRLSVCI
jgi:CBS domain-containing protein